MLLFLDIFGYRLHMVFCYYNVNFWLLLCLVNSVIVGVNYLLGKYLGAFFLMGRIKFCRQ